MRTTRAISIRQPWVELILRGVKKEEYRSRPTRIRERVYLYASKQPAGESGDWRLARAERGHLPTGRIVGSVEVVDCRWHSQYRCWAYVLKKPARLRSPLLPKNQPQPGFWRPQF